MRVTFLSANAYAGGGSLRATLALAAALAVRHEVDVVSVVRHRQEPLLPIDPRVGLRALVDNAPGLPGRRRPRRGPVGQTKGLVLTALGRMPSRLAHRQDVRYRAFSARSDLALIRFMRSLSGGVVIGTRPSLNLILARHAPGDVVAVGHEHLRLSRHSPQFRQSFAENYPQLDALVTQTAGDASDYRALLRNSIQVLALPHASPDLGAFRAALDPDTKVVVAAGRLTQQKGFDRLIAAFALVNRDHPDWSLDVYGVGPMADALQARIDGKGLAGVVRLRGFSTELYRRFAESAIFALTSRSEEFPTTLLEAMGCGLPVVGFDCPTGPADLILDGRNGSLIPDGDVPKLAAALNQLIDEPQLRRQMGACGAELAAEYAADRVAVRWEELFEELAQAPRRRAGPNKRRRLSPL